MKTKRELFYKTTLIVKIFLFIGFIFYGGISSDAQTKTWSLKACIDTAFKKNISLNQGQLTSQTNQINLVQSKAAVLPNLNLSDGHNFNSGYSLDPYTYQIGRAHV